MTHGQGFVIAADELEALLGTACAPSPGDLILSALNACMTATYVANAAAMGITLQSRTIHTQGNVDLRGFLGIGATGSADTTANPGFDKVEYEIAIKSNATAAELEVLHAKVRHLSPNFHTFLRPVILDGKLTVLD